MGPGLVTSITFEQYRRSKTSHYAKKISLRRTREKLHRLTPEGIAWAFIRE